MILVDKYNQYIFDLYMKTHPQADPNKVRSLIEGYTDRHVKDIPCIMHNNIYKEKTESSVLNVFDWIESRKPIITGNGTFFMQHKEYLAPTVTMLETLGANRKKKKKAMWQYGKGTVEYANAFTAQNSIKVMSNSNYGGSGTKFSPFYSMYIPAATTLSARALTTTLICCLEFVTGNYNKWAKLKNINELFDMIKIVLEDKREREIIPAKYHPNQVYDRLVLMTNDVSLQDANMLKLYLQTISSEELTKLMHAFNVQFVLSEYLSADVQVVMDFFKSNPPPMDLLSQKVKENTDTSIDEAKKLLFESGFGEKIPPSIEPAIKRLQNALLDNCIYPFMLNDVEVRAQNMERKIVCVTDTDSLMVHFAHYMDSFQAKDDKGNFKTSCLNALAMGMRLFIEAIIPRFVEYIGENCRIEDKYYRDKFEFKNEFGFLGMTLFAKKMYSASMFVQEGSPRDIYDIAITGLSFKKRDAAEFLEPIMVGLYRDYILTSQTVQPDRILDEFYTLRNRLLKDLTSSTEYFKVISVKEIGAYDPKRTLPDQMRGMIVWNNMMPDEEIMPMDRVKVVPLSWEKLHANTHIPRISEIIELNHRDDPKKKKNPVISIPEHYTQLPEWVAPVVNIEETVDKLLTPFRQLLGLFVVNIAETKGGMIPSRMICL